MFNYYKNISDASGRSSWENDGTVLEIGIPCGTGSRMIGAMVAFWKVARWRRAVLHAHLKHFWWNRVVTSVQSANGRSYRAGVMGMCWKSLWDAVRRWSASGAAAGVGRVMPEIPCGMGGGQGMIGQMSCARSKTTYVTNPSFWGQCPCTDASYMTIRQQWRRKQQSASSGLCIRKCNRETDGLFACPGING